MQRWPWRKILLGAALSMLLLGLAPPGYLLWFAAAHNLEPLSFSFPLQPGEYTSPWFTTDLDDGYQIEIYFAPAHRAPLNLDWKIVDQAGALLKRGSYREDAQALYANDIILDRQYRSRRGLSQKVIVTIFGDAPISTSQLTLHLGLPERSLGMAYGTAAALAWAAAVAGVGVILLLVWTLERWRRPALQA